MNKCFRSLISPVAAMVAIAVLAMATPARADLEIALSEDGGPGFTVVATAPSFTDVSKSLTFGDFKISIFGGSSDNGATLSDLLQSTTSVTNTSGATHTLHLWVSQDGYSSPAGSPLAMKSGAGGSVTIPTLTLKNIFEAFADKNNNLFGTGDYSNGLQSAIANGSTYQTGTASGTFARSGDYSLTSEVNFTLTAGGKANYGSEVDVTATPEPSTLALAGLGALGLVGYGLRRRKAMGA